MQRLRELNPILLIACLNILNVLTAAGPALAQDRPASSGKSAAPAQKTPNPSTRAAALYERAMTKMMVGVYDRACDDFGESYRLDPQPATLFALAECEAYAGRSATAAKRYEQYVRVFARMPNEWKALQNGRDQVAAQRAVELRAQSSQVTIALPPTLPAGTTVELDGTTLSIGEDNTIEDVPIDPGEHSVRIASQSGDQNERMFSISLREHKRLEVWGPSVSSVQTVNPSETASLAPLAPRATSDAGAAQGPAWPAYLVGGIGLAGISFGLTTALAPLPLGEYKDVAVGVPIAVGVFSVATAGMLLWARAARAPKESAPPAALSIAPALAVGGRRDAFLGITAAF